ncbi:MAG: transglutaminase domain-containing protein [Pirellula sp.]
MRSLSLTCVPCLALTLFLNPVVSLAQSEMETVLGWDHQLFPSYLIATASIKPSAGENPSDILGDPKGMMGVRLVASRDNEPVKVTVSCSEFIEDSEYSGILPTKDVSYNVMPKVRYRYDRLSQCRQATPASITLTVQIGSGKPKVISETVTFRSISDCPLAVRLGDSEVDLSFTFAAYVNEQHPFVDKMLREALDLGIVDRFTGYQSKSAEEVIRQAYSLWDLMVARDVRYSSITTTAADSNDVASQNVRLIEDSVNNTQANCVDGSVLFVSLLRKIGIEARLVLVPGHCYVAFAADPAGEIYFGLETTMVDAEVELLDEIPELFENAVDVSFQESASWASFLAAIEHGTSELGKAAEKFSDPKSNYHMIDVAQARKNGVLPIPFTSSETFVSFDHSAYVSNDSSEEEGEEEHDEEEQDEGDAE